MSGGAHVGLLEAVPQVRLLVELELVALVHGLGRLVVVAAADEEHVGALAHLDALVVVRQLHVHVVDSVIQSLAHHSVALSVILQQVLCVLLKHVDVPSQAGGQVLHHGHGTLVGGHDFLDLLVADQLVLSDLGASGHMLEEGLVAYTLLTARAVEHQHFKHFLHALISINNII